MGGRLICDVYVIWSEGETLMFKQFGVSFAHGGPACVVRGQIHLMGGDLRALNSLLFVIMFGVVGGRAMRMDGMLLTVAGNHRLNAPSATAVVMQRLADLPAGNGYPDQGALDRLLQRVKDAIASDNLKGLIALDILAAIAASAGDEANGVSAPILSVATERSLCRNELECDEKVARYSKTLREVFLAEDAPLLPMAPASGRPERYFLSRRPRFQMPVARSIGRRCPDSVASVGVASSPAADRTSPRVVAVMILAPALQENCRT